MRIAVIGCGEMGKRHARKLAGMADVDLVAVCDKNEIRAEALAEELGVDPVQEYYELIGKVDAAIVATNAITHAEICERLMNEATHVLVEKPVATLEADANHLTQVAETNGVVFQVGHIERFNPIFKRIAAVLDYPFRIEAWRFGAATPHHEVDVVLDLMIHDIDMVLSLAKSEITRITGSGSADTAISEIAFADGSVAVLRAGVASQKTRVWTVGADRHFLICEHDNLYDEQRHFIDCIRSGRKPEVGGMEAAAALRVALDITRQIQEGRCLTNARISRRG